MAEKPAAPPGAGGPPKAAKKDDRYAPKVTHLMVGICLLVGGIGWAGYKIATKKPEVKKRGGGH
ncbi:MAG: hypothetical protein L6R28_17790 [Planctomycetes bacterium]|nr:hypothetical protein [Planctomycetota bacterium]